MDSGQRAIVRAADQNSLIMLSNNLWQAEAFIPHGLDTGGGGGVADIYAAHQPIWLTISGDIVNAADVLVLINSPPLNDYALPGIKRCLYLFDSSNEQNLSLARQHWQQLKIFHHELSYWQQQDGEWRHKN